MMADAFEAIEKLEAEDGSSTTRVHDDARALPGAAGRRGDAGRAAEVCQIRRAQVRLDAMLKAAERSGTFYFRSNT